MKEQIMDRFPGNKLRMSGRRGERSGRMVCRQDLQR